jgi:hypothetical protein
MIKKKGEEGNGRKRREEEGRGGDYTEMDREWAWGKKHHHYSQDRL